MWIRSNVIGLSRQTCAKCHGIGTRGVDKNFPCPCVCRSIFRTCLAKVREIADFTVVAWYSALGAIGNF